MAEPGLSAAPGKSGSLRALEQHSIVKQKKAMPRLNKDVEAPNSLEAGIEMNTIDLYTTMSLMNQGIGWHLTNPYHVKQLRNRSNINSNSAAATTTTTITLKIMF